MKKTVTFLLAVLFIMTAVLSSCGSDDTGPIIPIYYTKELQNFDPAIPLYDAETVKVLGLIFEGLTYLDEDGDVHPGLAESWYTKIDEERGEYFLYFELKETSWNDDRLVQADDFVYAWKRILSPSTNSPAACLLYNIKNARDVKSGIMTVDDLGVAAVSESLLEIEFEGPFDLDYFLMTVSSPALVPLREDAVLENPSAWAKSLDALVFNGPFVVRNWKYGASIDFERNTRYLLDEDATNEMKYVTPYKLTVDYSMSLKRLIEAWENYENEITEIDGKEAIQEEIFYFGDLTAEKYEEYKDDVVEHDLLSVYTYYFNTEKEPFTDARVRHALSIALDRNEIASIASRGNKPATGFVTYNVFDNDGEDFREVGGELISTSAQLDEARSLLAEAGVDGGSFTITYGVDSADKDIASYVQDVWESLGFDVEITQKRGVQFQDALENGDFDVIGIDYQGLTPDAFAFLAPFATEYSGSVVNVDLGSDTYTPHITGFNSPEYDAIIDKAFYAKTESDRNAALHEAEALLLELSPIVPLHFNTDIYYASSKLKNIETSIYGYKVFNDTTLKGYEETNERYLAEEKAKAEAETEQEMENAE